MMNLTLHAIASDIGTRLEKGPATLDELAREIEGLDGLNLARARLVVRRFLSALCLAQQVRRENRTFRLTTLEERLAAGLTG